MRITIRRIGNSKGVIIPAAMLAEVGLEAEAELTIKDGMLILQPPAREVRAGWAAAARAIAESSDDPLVLPEFSNDGDAELQW